MHLNCELIFKKYGSPYFKDNLKVLEIGPAGIPSIFNKIINNSTITWHTLDIASYEGLTYSSEDEYNYPIPEDSYDIILSGNVIEHVKHIWKWMRELKRISKKEGSIIIINPISWPYHEAPVDCWRIYPEGMKALCEEVGLNVKFCFWGTLEKELLNNMPSYPGMSYSYGYHPGYIKYIKYVMKWNKFVKWLPKFRALQIPLPIAYDMITVASK